MASMMHTLVYSLMLSQKSYASDIFLQQQTRWMQALETSLCFNMMVRIHSFPPTALNLTPENTQDS
jgi:hypothetical protein